MNPYRNTWSKIALTALAGAGAWLSAHADYTWRGTNSTTWGVAGNWLANSISPTNQTVGNRLDVNNASYNGMVYDAGEGTTIYNGASGGRGLVIGSGSVGSGTLTINGGTLMTTNTGPDIAGNTAGNKATLTINGGNLISGDGSLVVSYGGGTTCIGIVNVNGGFASFGSLSMGYNATLNLNGGLTTFTNEINPYSGGVSTNNFNGGTLQARANSSAFIPAYSGTQLNVRNGGAVIDSAGYNLTIVPVLAHSTISTDSVTDGGLTKLNGGTLTLSAAPTYTGPTVVSGGRLTMPPPLSSSSLAVATGAHFSPIVGTTEWLASSAALTNAALDFSYGNWSVNGNTNASLYFTNLALSGSVTCNITGTAFPVTNITLLAYGSKTGTGSFVLGTLPSGAAATLTDNGSAVILNLTTASIANLVWSGGDGIWQTNGGFDWNTGTAQYSEYASGVGDVVSFDDSGPGGTVTIGTQVKPGATTFNNSSTSYTLSGPGSLGGTNGIALTGTGSLTIMNTNNFTGPVTFTGGSGTTGATLFVGSPNALGATNGSVTVGGPANTLELGISGGNAVVVSNKTVVINGTGAGGARGALRGQATVSGTNVWAGPVVIGTDLTRVGTEDSGTLVLAGPITDNGANLGLYLRPGTSGFITVSSGGNTYGYTRVYGDASTSYINLGANNALATNRLDLGPVNLNLNGYSQTVSGINDNTGTGTIVNNGTAASTLTIFTGTNTAGSFSTGSAIKDGTSKISVVVSGSGSQTLYGTVSYSGNTTISGGTLYVTTAGPINSAITVGSGAALGGTAGTTNSLTLAANSTLVVNPSAGAFWASSVNASASPINVLLSSAAPTNTATLVLTGTNGITGSAANFHVVGVRGGTFYLTNANTQLMFVPSTVNASLVWKGNNPANPSYWDTITTTNWSNGGTPDKFFTGDNVTFDDTASSFNVAIQGSSVLPASVTVSSSSNYTFSGVIAGGATLTKGGTGTLFLNNNNSYTGGTTITNGVVAIQTSGALGATNAAVTIAGTGSLDLDTTAGSVNTLNLGATMVSIAGNGYGGIGAIVNNSPSAMQTYAMQQIVLANNASIGGDTRWDMRGTGNAINMQNTNTLTKVGGNYIALVSTLFNNPGNIVVNGGTLGLQVAANLGGSSANTLTVNGGGILEMYQLGTYPAWSLILNSNSVVNPDNGSGGWAGPVTLNGPATLQADATLTITGPVGGTGPLIKTGNQTCELTVSNAYTGNTIVQAGTLTLDTPSLAAGSTVIITNSGVLNLNFTGTNAVAGLVINGTNEPPGYYYWATSSPTILGSGVLQVVSATPPVLVATPMGANQIQFSWTGTGVLQAQTNTLGNGLGTNWGTYPGTSPVTVTVDPANPCVFFRIAQ